MQWVLLPLMHQCLNPCFNGIWSRTPHKFRSMATLNSLNPCFNGIWSRTTYELADCKGRAVLILVLMEYGLGLHPLMFNQSCGCGLNPCFNGIWSRTLFPSMLLRTGLRVS